MKYKIKIIEIDERVEDVEFFINFVFMDSNIIYRAILFSVNSNILYSFLNEEITANLSLEIPQCKPNPEFKNSWFNYRLNSHDKNPWSKPSHLNNMKDLSSTYLCSGKIQTVILNEFDEEYYRLESQYIIDISTEINCWEKEDIEQNQIKIGEYYTFRGGLTITTIDEIEEIYKSKTENKFNLN